MTNGLTITTPTVASSSPAEGLSVERLRTIIQDSHLNFLIGAGSSVPFIAPLGDVENVLAELKEANDETLLARASVQGYFFDRVLLPNLRLLDAKTDVGAQTLIKSYGRFVGTLNRILLKRRSTLLGKQVNLFTTNIDMAFEHALELLEIDTNDGFAGKIRPRLDLGEFSTLRFRQGARYEYRSEIPTFNLFKIHGSAGWQRDGEEIYFDHRLEVIRAVQLRYESAKATLLPINEPKDVDAVMLRLSATGKVLDQVGLDFAEAYKDLQIVNPEKTKFASTVLNKTYYELIRRFANELEKENTALLAHGFSFRDEHLLDLVLRASAANPTLQVIVFCYAREAFQEIKALFPPEKVKNGNILFVRPAEPKEGAEERKLSLDVVVEDFLEQVLEEKTSPADHVIELRLGSGDDV